MIELGPIRPPSEGESILLRVTKNCAWNRCKFCSLYRDERFSVRAISEVKNDIDTISNIYNEFKELSFKMGFSGKIVPQVVRKIEDRGFYEIRDIQQVAYWSYFGLKNLFLQDGDSMVLSTEKILEILNYIKEKLPSVERITTYARSSSVARKSLAELLLIKKAGLDRIHIGFESGSNDVLKLINKGVTVEEHIVAGQNVMKAGFELSEYYMPGVGGAKFSNEHALESAKILNLINPTFIRIRSYIPIPGTEINNLMESGKWILPSELDKVVEIKKFLQNLDGISSKIVSDHMLNLIQELEGNFLNDKGTMLKLLENFLNLSKEDQENFIIGRRTGQFRFLKDFVADENIENLKKKLKKEYGSVDNAILGIMRQYI